MLGYIYETRNLLNNKVYIGQHKNYEHNIKYLGSGKIITLAIDKYGKENFSNNIICWCKDQEDMNKKEIYYISLYNKFLDTYNLAMGGSFGDPLRFASKEVREASYNKMVKTRKEKGIGVGKLNPMYKSGEKGIHPLLGKHHKEKTKEKISKSLMGNIPWNKGNKKEKVEISYTERYMNNKCKVPIKITHLESNNIEYFESRNSFKNKYPEINIKYALYKNIFKGIKFETISKEDFLKNGVE